MKRTVQYVGRRIVVDLFHCLVIQKRLSTTDVSLYMVYSILLHNNIHYNNIVTLNNLIITENVIIDMLL